MPLWDWFRNERALARIGKRARRGDALGALEEAQKALGRSPGNLSLKIQRIWALSDLKRSSEALSAVDEALKDHPKNAVLHMLRGEVLFDMGDFEGAREALHAALDHGGENLRVEYHLGRVYVALSDMDRAAQFFESSVRYDKNLVNSRLLAMAERYLFEKR